MTTPKKRPPSTHDSSSDDEVLIIEESWHPVAGPSKPLRPPAPPPAPTPSGPIKKETKLAPIFASPVKPTTPKKRPRVGSPLPAKSSTSTTTTTSTTESPDVKPTTFFPSPSSSSSSTNNNKAFTSKSSSRPVLDANDKSLNTSIYDFEPGRDINPVGWPQGRLPFAFLVQAYVLISSTRSRLQIERVMTNLFRVVIELDDKSLADVIQITSNHLSPAHEGIELGFGGKGIVQAIRKVSNSSSAVWNCARATGDIGDAAFMCKGSGQLQLAPPPPLSTPVVFATLLEISRIKGSGGQELKVKKAMKLLAAAQGEEVRYIARILAQNLRIGAVGKTLTKSLARAFCLSRPPSFHQTPDNSDRFLLSPSTRHSAFLSEQYAASKKTKAKAPDDSAIVEARQKFAEAEADVRAVWAVRPDYPLIVEALLKGGLENLTARIPLAVGTPVQPMLGSITRSIEEVYERLGNRPFISEAKVDGQRIQIHVAAEAPDRGGKGRWSGSVEGEGEGGAPRFWYRLFSKHHEDMTDKYPDLVPTLSAIIQRESSTSEPLTSFVIDAEIAAISAATGHVLPFQELAQRKRKDVNAADVTIRVAVFTFDLMYLNGRSLLLEPFRYRRNLLRSKFGTLNVSDPTWAQWKPIQSIEETEHEAVEQFLQDCIENKMEGLMIKLLDEVEVEIEEPSHSGDDEDIKPQLPKTRRKAIPAAYTPDVRGMSWLKLKKDYLHGMGDSLDMVPIGAWQGTGRKAKWWSPILLACYDAENGRLVAMCKCMSGFSDAFYKDLKVRYAVGSENTSSSRFPGVDADGVSPEIWFKPMEVWEIKGADITVSPRYPAARNVLNEHGVSLRFPRFIRLRDDKAIENATTEDQIAEMFRKQMRAPSAAVAASRPPPETGENEDDSEAELSDDEEGLTKAQEDLDV